MNTVFPVAVGPAGEADKKTPNLILQGFTRDISAGGMCVELKSFSAETEQAYLLPDHVLSLSIEPPFTRHPIHASARIAWVHRQGESFPARYLIGVAYTEIDDKAKKRLFKYAQRLLWIPRLAAVAGVVMLFMLAGLFIHNQKLILENKALVNRLVEGAEKKSSVSSELYELQKKKNELEKNLRRASAKIKNLEVALAALTDENRAQQAEFQAELEASLAVQRETVEKLSALHGSSKALEATYRSLKETEQMTASLALRQMVDWIRSHQNLRTGLVASFEGDRTLEDWAFTYDQSLACQTYLLFNDFENASRILSFYQRASQEDGAYFNAYHAGDGTPVERLIHVGPNVWMGIAALQYENKVKDGKYLGLARNVASWILQNQDAEGGFKGGPSVSWYSTEHNLDAYAFLRMMYEATGESLYAEASARALEWIQKYAYSVKERRMNRGKGDATIATDTFSWAIAAIGADKLSEINFDPEAIIQFAEENCEVSVTYKQPSGKLATAKGFDFAKAENIGRGGVISTEWTAQMIVTYRILSDYFERSQDGTRADLYSKKADLYLNELQKLIITSPSRTGQGRGCLPYASIDNVDTGHGWRTPKGRRTGSVSGTAYGIFAWVGYNPFDLEHKKAVR